MKAMIVCFSSKAWDHSSSMELEEQKKFGALKQTGRVRQKCSWRTWRAAWEGGKDQGRRKYTSPCRGCGVALSSRVLQEEHPAPKLIHHGQDEGKFQFWICSQNSGTRGRRSGGHTFQKRCSSPYGHVDEVLMERWPCHTDAWARSILQVYTNANCSSRTGVWFLFFSVEKLKS